MSRMGRVLTIGNITKDIIIDRSGNRRVACGGTTYASVAARRLSYDSYLVTKNGRISMYSSGDETIGYMIDLVKEEGVKRYWEPDEHSTVFVNDYSSGERMQQLLDSTDVITYPPKLRDSNFGRFDIVLLNPMFHEITSETAELAKKDCSADGIVVLDVQGLVREVKYPGRGVSIGFWEDREEYLGHIDVLKVGSEEIKGVSKLEDHRDVCKELYELGPSVVALTFGAEGSLVYDGKMDEIYKIPAFKTKVVDKTGAGDVFSLALAIGLHKKRDVLKAGVWANTVSSFVVEGLGSRGIPPIEKVEERYEILKRQL